MGRTHITTTIDEKARAKARELNLEYSGALEFGIIFRAAEIEDSEYPNNLLSHKIERLAERLEEANRRIEELEGEKIGENFEYPGKYYGN